MSSVLNPVGPEEPSTYWRRRAVVLVVLLVVIWLLWMLLSSALGSDEEPTADAPSPSPSFGLTISPEPEPSASPEASDPQASASASPGAASASATPSPSATGACRDRDVEVVAGTSAASTTVGAGLGLTMTVTTTGSGACVRDVGAGANELRITSGSVLVWSSDFCNPSDAAQEAVLAPGEPWSTSLTWPGTVTAEGCPSDQPTAQPGTYRVVARNGSVQSEPVVFTVG